MKSEIVKQLEDGMNETSGYIRTILLGLLLAVMAACAV
jgi:hypothetical protein